MASLFDIERCIRCNKVFKDNARTMSRMNTDVICLKCNKEEKEHEKYKEAVNAELQEVKKGNYNYKGLYYGQKYPFKK